MTETGPGGGTGAEDRVSGLDPVDGFAFESDGSPIAELDVHAADAVADRLEGAAQQAIYERSWRFGHVIVDEAQDLTPMQWRMIARRSHGGAVTIVGDLAQRSIGSPGEWADHLPPELQGFAHQELTINYRAPAEANELAAAVLAELAPGLTPARSIRAVGEAPTASSMAPLDERFGPWLADHRARHPDGRLAVIAERRVLERLRAAGESGGSDDATWLTPWQAKGLEFDVVVIVEPAAIVDEPGGLSLLYVAVTRTTRTLAVVHERPLPPVLAARLQGDG